MWLSRVFAETLTLEDAQHMKVSGNIALMLPIHAQETSLAGSDSIFVTRFTYPVVKERPYLHTTICLKSVSA